MSHLKIFMLTRDDYYFIIDKNVLRKSAFFSEIFKRSHNYGTLKNPIFLQNVESRYFKYAKKYLHLYENKSDSFNEDLTIEDDEIFYNEDDNYFFSKFLNEEDNDKDLLKTLKFLQLPNMVKKLEYYNLMKK